MADSDIREPLNEINCFTLTRYAGAHLTVWGHNICYKGFAP
jgi:hypothetical protein